MSLKGLSSFQFFSLEDFLIGKRLVFVKASPWREGEGKDINLEGSKVLLQIAEDKTQYAREDIDNFGEQFTVKVRGVAPSAYNKLKPLNTEMTIDDVERAVLYGEYRNELSIIAVVNVKN
jgi:hypothetical protein